MEPNSNQPFRNDINEVVIQKSFNLVNLKLFSDFVILYLVQKFRYVSLRQISYYSSMSLGTAHTKILSLSKKNLLIVKDISDGSRKKKFQYLLTKEGVQHLISLREKLELFIDDLNNSLLRKSNTQISEDFQDEAVNN